MAAASPVNTTPGTSGPGTEPVRASLPRRFLALFVDWILCLLVASLLASPNRVPLIPSLVLILEYTLFVGFFGQTPGMFLARIRCVSVLPGRAGHPIGAARAALRGLLLALAVPALLMDQDQRGLHDKAAGSRMIRA